MVARLLSHIMKSPFYLFILLFCCACGSNVPTQEKTKKPKAKKDYPDFVFKERIVQGTDTAVLNIRDLGTADFDKVLAQHWMLTDVEDASDDRLVWKNGNESRRFPEIILFPDQSAIIDPRMDMTTGTWTRKLEDKIHTIYFQYDRKKSIAYRIRELSATKLKLSWKDGKDSFWINYRSDGKLHQNMLNDPFYPVNNKWRIKPSAKETDVQIFERVKGCVRFYALYYRDAIKRKKKEIAYSGLPEIFEWYSQAIGLPDKKLVEDSWVNCFYNKEQAWKGYDILHKIIVDYEYDWPKGVPGWEYQTHSVLEQMYFKMDSLQKIHRDLDISKL